MLFCFVTAPASDLYSVPDPPALNRGFYPRSVSPSGRRSYPAGVPCTPHTAPASPPAKRRTARKAGQQAVENGVIRVNPSDACKLPRVEKKDIRPLDDAQISEFLKVIQGHPYEYLYKVALFTGIREGEVLGLTWDCLDLDAGTLTVKQQLRREQHKDGQFYFSKPKNNKTRVLTLAPSVVKLFRLQKLEQNGKRLKAGKRWVKRDLVFSDETGDFLSHRVIYRCFKELVKEIGTPSTRFHDLRHTYAVMAIQSGDDIKTVQENLGHATAAFTLDVYGHVTAQMKKASADRMEKKIQAASGL